MTTSVFDQRRDWLDRLLALPHLWPGQVETVRILAAELKVHLTDQETKMHETYTDITSRIAEEPSWYDQNGTPRYGEFVPWRCPNIYSDNVGLFCIECQMCAARFSVELHTGIFESLENHPHTWHYGDPPAHRCAGDTMNCNTIAVLEFWHRESAGRWRRCPGFEGAIMDHMPPLPLDQLLVRRAALQQQFGET